MNAGLDSAAAQALPTVDQAIRAAISEMAGASMPVSPENSDEDDGIWTEADEAALEALPPAAKALFDKRLGLLQVQLDEQLDAARFGSGIRELIDDGLREKLRVSGLDEVGGLRHLIEMERFASANPAEYLRFVAQHLAANGMDVAQALGLGQPQGAEIRDPRVDAIQQEIGQLRQHLQQMAAEKMRQEGEAAARAHRQNIRPTGRTAHAHKPEIKSLDDAINVALRAMSA